MTSKTHQFNVCSLVSPKNVLRTAATLVGAAAAVQGRHLAQSTDTFVAAGPAVAPAMAPRVAPPVPFPYGCKVKACAAEMCAYGDVDTVLGDEPAVYFGGAKVTCKDATSDAPCQDSTDGPC